MVNFSFEFFPTKTYYNSLKLLSSAKSLERFDPRFVTVTSSRGEIKNQLDSVVSLMRIHKAVAPHLLSCYNKQQTVSILQNFIKNGINHIVILKGDSLNCNSRSKFYDVENLICFIRQQFKGLFRIEVANYPDCHPQNTTPAEDAKSLLSKIKCGANAAITQFFYDSNSYFKILDECHKHNINNLITPGVMPIISYEQLIRFNNLCRSTIPSWIAKRIESFKQDIKSLIKVGIEFIVRLCEDLIQYGIKDLHFYTLNNHQVTGAICGSLKKELNSF